MTVAANIGAIMDAKGETAASLARRAGINPTGVYDILSGKSRSPRIETLSKIASALSVPLPILFEDAPNDMLRAELEALYDRLEDSERRRFVLSARAWVETE